MVGGRLPLLSCLFTCNAVLLLGVCLYDVEASSCQKVLHKKVGDTVEFSSCLSAGVTYAEWRFGKLTIAEKDVKVPEKPQFKDRLNLNPTDFNLTVTRLTLQDSGDYSFVSGTDTEQWPTLIITLQVHEPITTRPVLTFNSTWHGRNESCKFLLECIATSDISSVTYKWTVRNQSMNGSTLQYYTSKKDGDTRFTCTVSNYVSEMSTSETFKCSNDTGEIGPQKPSPIIVLSAAVGGCLLTVIVVGVAVCVCHSKRSRAGSDADDLTVYADITEVAMAEVGENGGTSSTMKPCSVYETIENKVNSPMPKPQTVYDKIQFNRVRETSPSPYQDIS